MSHAETVHYIRNKPRPANRTRPRQEHKPEVADASPELDREAQTHDKMLSQLRAIITGPQTQLNETRYEEFINILSEQKQTMETMFSTFDQNFRTAMGQSQAHLMELDQIVAKLGTKIDAEDHATRRTLTQALDKLRDEQVAAVRNLTLATEQHLKELESRFRHDHSEFSEKFVAYAQESNKKREEDKSQYFAVLEQSMSAVRAEMMDLRQRDIAEIGNSVTEIGLKLAEKSRA